MTKRKLIFGLIAVVALLGAAIVTRAVWSPKGAVAQAPQGSRALPVDVIAAAKKPMPVRVDAIGSVVPIASVAIKSRIETEIVKVHFEDGARVKQGDVLFTLDSRAIEAQIMQAEGLLARDRAQLEGAERDVRRYTELIAKNATPQINLDNAKTQADIFRAAIKTDQAALDNLRVMLSYCTIRAPISGRISAAAVKVGNFVRPADATALATINQVAPTYVAFSVPQRTLPELRQAMDKGTAQVNVVLPAVARPITGRVAMIENSVDATTGMVMVRAIMDNDDERLWPGTLVNTQLTLRVEESVVIPSVAVQVGQSNSYVFVVKDGVANVQPVTVARTVEQSAIIAKGLEGGETVVTDGQLLLTNGSRVAAREAKAGS